MLSSMPTALLNAPTRINVSKHPLSFFPHTSPTHRLNTPSLSTDTSIPSHHCPPVSFLSRMNDALPAQRVQHHETCRASPPGRSRQPSRHPPLQSFVLWLPAARDHLIFTCGDARCGELARLQGPPSDLTTSRRERASGQRIASCRTSCSSPVVCAKAARILATTEDPASTLRSLTS